MQSFQYGSLPASSRVLKRAITLSLSVHAAVLLAFLVHAFIKPKPPVKRNLYMFEMVDTKPQYKVKLPAFVSKPVEQPKEKKKAVKPEQKKAKALSVRKATQQDKMKETPKEEIQSEEKPHEEAVENEAAVESGINIVKPGFPFNYYEAQIFNAINRNWRQVPEELLGAEEKLIVLVTFDIQKDGHVENVTISESSWNSILDGLALRAVEKAKIPPIPGDDPMLTVACRLV